MKKLLFFLLMFSPLWTQAQTADQAEEIKNNADLIWGQGYGATVKEADRQALADLMSKISVQIESDFVIDDDKNYYRNYMSPENDFVNGITREAILGGYDSFILYRNSTDGKVPVAKLKLAVNSQNKVLYKITYFDENEDYNTPNFNNEVLPSIINQLLNNQ